MGIKDLGKVKAGAIFGRHNLGSVATSMPNFHTRGCAAACTRASMGTACYYGNY